MKFAARVAADASQSASRLLEIALDGGLLIAVAKMDGGEFASHRAQIFPADELKRMRLGIELAVVRRQPPDHDAVR